MERNKFICPKHNHKMLIMYGYGWDYDRYLCPIGGCEYEIELETTTYPEEKMTDFYTEISLKETQSMIKTLIDKGIKIDNDIASPNNWMSSNGKMKDKKFLCLSGKKLSVQTKIEIHAGSKNKDLYKIIDNNEFLNTALGALPKMPVPKIPKIIKGKADWEKETCKKCFRPIQFITTPNGKRIPVDITLINGYSKEDNKPVKHSIYRDHQEYCQFKKENNK